MAVLTFIIHYNILMNKIKILLILILINTCHIPVFSQIMPATGYTQNDSLLKVLEILLLQQHKQQQIDSLKKSQLMKSLLQVTGDKQKTRILERKLKQIVIKDSIRRTVQLNKIAKLKKSAKSYAVAPFNDTIFLISTKIGSFSARERATAINLRIKKLYRDPFYTADSLKIIESENGYDILYKNETLILSVTDLDALWLNKDNKLLAIDYLTKIKKEIANENKTNSLNNWLKRLGLVALIILGLGISIFFINKLVKRFTQFFSKNQEQYLNAFTIRNINLVNAEQFQKIAFRLIYILRIVGIVFAVYFSLLLLFSVFPKTKALTDTLSGWILTPVKLAFSGVIQFLPNLFTILVIYFIFRYTIKGLKYFVDEIEKGNIHLSGFHPDWAQPTFNIVKFLLYAFMIVLIFPYLPGSNSAAFGGVSVFIGVLLSLGSSSAISNMIAGLVITYMRPFKIGDRIKIGDITGDVIEKTTLVTRIRTIKNEDITVPNSTVLSSNTINYSGNTKPEDKGLILHTTVTIGYDVPWNEMHKALIKAALRTEMILHEPQPFVLQTSLDDFYVTYQINAYTKEANNQAVIYSQLHQNIQDCSNEAGIEILSPHYRQLRDGNMTTIPGTYLNKKYKAPVFKVKHVKD